MVAKLMQWSLGIIRRFIHFANFAFIMYRSKIFANFSFFFFFFIKRETRGKYLQKLMTENNFYLSDNVDVVINGI